MSLLAAMQNMARKSGTGGKGEGEAVARSKGTEGGQRQLWRRRQRTEVSCQKLGRYIER